MSRFSLPWIGPRNEPRRPAARKSRLLAELRLASGAIAWLLLLLALLSYHRDDPSWSTSGTAAHATANLVGAAGAWVADILYFLLGFSALWILPMGLYALLRAWRHAHPAALEPAEEAEAAPWWRRLGFAAGLALLPLSSAALEATRLWHLGALLPGQAGGVVGSWLGVALQHLLGFTGSAIVLLAMFLLSLSWFARFSWVDAAERTGAGIEWAWTRLRARRALRQDREAGQQALREREADVQDQAAREAEEVFAPVFIEPAVVQVAQSPRVQRERQKPLFQEMPNSALPTLDLLDQAQAARDAVSAETLEFTSRLIEKKLKDFGVSVRVVAALPGPVITRYEVEPEPGVKGSQVVTLSRDLARALSLVSIRVVETIPGKNTMALELPNAKRQTIGLGEILGSQVYNDAQSMLTMGLGKDIVGKPVVADLARMPHLLVAGTTGSGKSVGINAMILSLLYKAEARQVRLIMIDPKMLELSVYEGIPHLLAPVVTDMKQAAHALNWCVGEMDRRYKVMSKLGVRNLASYNARIAEAAQRGEHVPNPLSLTPESPEPLQHMPFIVVVIDELADLMMVVGKKIEELIARLAQKARAAGIHLILATQRPSVDVITGLIKANIPTRIAFQVSSKVDSRTILDQMGAESLLGMGDMLYLPPGSGAPQRVHGAFVSDSEVHRVVEQLKTQGEPDYVPGLLEPELGADGEAGGFEGGGDAESDPLYDQAVQIVLQNRKASISLVQRHLRIGYNRSARLLDQMEKAGLVSPLSSNGNRDILVPARGEP
ncbi:DNA translocase FtsK 4TM domain-containing protein [Thiomonas sp. FB-6]|uniref:DNA translocase FtsK n=1 Tax=Thiomonas sp. FB-6 TaxID=1158291 RepID=UPI00037E1354